MAPTTGLRFFGGTFLTSLGVGSDLLLRFTGGGVELVASLFFGVAIRRVNSLAFGVAIASYRTRSSVRFDASDSRSFAINSALRFSFSKSAGETIFQVGLRAVDGVEELADDGVAVIVEGELRRRVESVGVADDGR